MDWIHCNDCCVGFNADSRTQFFLTSCGHLYCSECVANLNNVCLMCKSKFAAMNLSPPIRDDIAVFFKEPNDIIQEFQKILTFQNGHRLQLFNYYATMSKKYNNLTSSNEKLVARVNELENEIAGLKTQLKSAQEELTASSLSTSFTLGSNNFFGRLGGFQSTLNRVTPPSVVPQLHHSGPQSHHSDATLHRSVLTLSTPQEQNRLSVTNPPSGGRIGKIPGSISSTSGDSGDRGIDSFNSMMNRYSRKKLAEVGKTKKMEKRTEFPAGNIKSSEDYSTPQQPLVHGSVKSRDSSSTSKPWRSKLSCAIRPCYTK